MHQNKSMKIKVVRLTPWLLVPLLSLGAMYRQPSACAAEPVGELAEHRPGSPTAPLDHPCPRLKLSASGFSIQNLDGRSVPLSGIQLDAYPLSERWVRLGFGLQGGSGRASAIGSSIDVKYGLLGLTAGIQYPGRVTPFLEGHISGGALAGRQVGSITVGGTTVSGNSGTTWIYGRGLNLGAEFYVSGRVYVSAALGWMRATWGAPDLTARVQNPRANIGLVDITSDSLLWKLGIGI